MCFLIESVASLKTSPSLSPRTVHPDAEAVLYYRIHSGYFLLYLLNLQFLLICTEDAGFLQCARSEQLFYNLQGDWAEYKKYVYSRNRIATHLLSQNWGCLTQIWNPIFFLNFNNNQVFLTKFLSDLLFFVENEMTLRKPIEKDNESEIRGNNS